MISIVTITYNNFSELKETLDSIKGIQNIESIVINGGNCEKTKELLANHSGVVVSEPDSGIADAMNKGLKRASGLGVMFLNSGDVLIQRDYLETAERMLQEYDFIHSNIIFDDSMVGPIHMVPALCSPGRGMPYFHQSMVVKKSLLDRVGLFSTQYKIAMDFDYVIRMQKLNARGYYYQAHPSIRMDGKGVSATQEEKSLQEALCSLKENKVYHSENRIQFGLRQFGFKTRRLMLSLGLIKLLGTLKRAKRYSQAKLRK